MRKLSSTMAAAASATALAVGMAAPATANTNVLWFVENDKSYTFEGTASAEANLDNGDGDTLPSGPFAVSVAPGEHKYLGWGGTRGTSYSYYWTKYSISSPVAHTDAATYPMGDDACIEVNSEADNYSYPTDCLGSAIPDWLSVRSGEDGDHVNETWTLTWDAPVEQEAQLANLASMPTSDCTITGTPGDDRIQGTDGNDVICGLGGDDVIEGGDGDDIIKGGAGDDTIHGGDGDDTLGGGAGNDRVDGGSGDDAMHGATGEDTLVGGSGDDLTDGGSGDDILAPDFALAKEGALQMRSGMGIQSSEFIRHAMHTNTLASTDGTGNVIEDGNGDGVTAGFSLGDQEYWDCQQTAGFDFSCFS